MSNQDEFDFLCPFRRNLLRPDEVAQCLGRSVQHVYDLIEEGKLEAHAPTDREKQRYMITRRSVLLALADTALYGGSNYVERVERVLDVCTPDQLSRLIVYATQRRARINNR